MPNHVHVLLTPLEGVALNKIVGTFKSVSATKIGKLSGKPGGIWQDDYFDRWMRNSDHFARTAEYIAWNPKKAGLVDDPALWTWSSANANSKARLEFLARSADARSASGNGSS